MHDLDALVSLLNKENMEFLSSAGKFTKQPTSSSVYLLQQSKSTKLEDRTFVPTNYDLTDKEKGKIKNSNKGIYICRDAQAKENPLQFIVKHTVDLSKNRLQALKEACNVKEYFNAFNINRTGLNIEYVLILDFQHKIIDEKTILAELHTVLRGQGPVKFRFLYHDGKGSVLSAVYTATNAKNAFSEKQPAITAFAQRIDPFANLAAEATRLSLPAKGASQSAKGSSQSSASSAKKTAAKRAKPKVGVPAITLDKFFTKASGANKIHLNPVEVIEDEVPDNDVHALAPENDPIVHQEPAAPSAPLESMIRDHSQSLLETDNNDDVQQADIVISLSPALISEHEKVEKRSVDISAQTDLMPRPINAVKRVRIDDEVSDLTEPEDESVELDEAFFEYDIAFREFTNNSMAYISNNHVYKAFSNNSLIREECVVSQREFSPSEISKRIVSRREFLPSELQRLETFFRQELSQLRSLSSNLARCKPHVEVVRLQRTIAFQIESSTKSLKDLHKIQNKYLFGQSVAPFAHKYLATNEKEILLAFQKCLPQVSADVLENWYRENNFAVLLSIADCCYQKNVAVLNPSASDHIASIARYLAFYLIMIHPEGKSLISTAKETVEIPLAVLEMIQTYIGAELNAIDKGPVLDSLANAYLDLSNQDRTDCRSLALKKHLSALNGLQNQARLQLMVAN